MIEAVVRPKKRLFLLLIVVSLVIAALSTYGLWIVSMPGLSRISAYLPYILGGFLVLVLFAALAGIAGIVLAILGFATPIVFFELAWSAVNLLFPMAIRIGRLLDVEKERVERSFIEVSNHLVRQKNVKVPPEKLLLLSPHCIQQEACMYKITRNVENCRICGGCQVGEILALSKKYQVQFAVVTGGTLARKVIKELRPKAILAIACERDLTSGIQDVFPLPVIGVLNERPFGPCCNTRVNLTEVEKAIQDFVVRGEK